MSQALMSNDDAPPPVLVADDGRAPVQEIRPENLQMIAAQLRSTFSKYESERVPLEDQWLTNLRQFLGVYDPALLEKLGADRSRAYPRLTRIKCVSTVARLMNMMFPGNERNWTLSASPSPTMAPPDVMQAVQDMMARRQKAGAPAEMDQDLVDSAVAELASKRAEKLSLLIDDQLQEIGGDQTADYISMNKKAVMSGVLYGAGVLRGPFVRKVQKTIWAIDSVTRQPQPRTRIIYKPQFQFLRLWDFYPDLAAKDFKSMSGYFVREVMSRAQVRELAERPDFFAEQIKTYLGRSTSGNFVAKRFETMLRQIGTTQNVQEQKPDSQKYEILVWHGVLSAHQLREAGVMVPDDKVSGDVEAEVWMLGDTIIKASLNSWRQIGVEMQTIHVFQLDANDTGLIGDGLPAIIRDSQMSVAAATRMMMDNAGVVCGPNLELNIELLDPTQDLDNIYAYKVWKRNGTGVDAQYPAVRNVTIDGHLTELQSIVQMFMGIADAETFVGPATGGDMSRGPSEPFRTAAGASMLRGDAALPFKDIVRSFDLLTQSVITAMVAFNVKLNPDEAQPGDYDVIARGSTSLMAKEILGMHLDQLAATMTPEEKMHVDERKFVRARFAVRDLGDLLVSDAEAQMRKDANSAKMQEMEDQQRKMLEAQVRETLAQAFKNITQGQKNQTAADVDNVMAALKTLEMYLVSGDKDNGSETKADRSSGASAK